MELGWCEKLAMQLRLGWNHEYGDAGRRAPDAVHGLGCVPAARRRLIGLAANTAIADATSIYLRYRVTSPDRTAPMRSPRACA
jgi:hypothetical protein